MRYLKTSLIVMSCFMPAVAVQAMESAAGNGDEDSKFSSRVSAGSSSSSTDSYLFKDPDKEWYKGDVYRMIFNRGEDWYKKREYRMSEDQKNTCIGRAALAVRKINPSEPSVSFPDVRYDIVKELITSAEELIKEAKSSLEPFSLYKKANENGDEASGVLKDITDDYKESPAVLASLVRILDGMVVNPDVIPRFNRGIQRSFRLPWTP